MLKRVLFFLLIVLTSSVNAHTQSINMVFTSDAHYALTRKNFQGDTNVSAKTVNAAMIKKINTIPGLVLPADGGMRSGKKVGAVDYVIQTGDIANRMEPP